MAIYFIQCGSFVKIGYAKNVKSRAIDIQTASPYDVELLGVIDTDEPVLLERTLHDMFRDYHHRGEWFRLNSVVSSYIAQHATTSGEPINVIDAGTKPSDKLITWVKNMRHRIDVMRAAEPVQLDLL